MSLRKGIIKFLGGNITNPPPQDEESKELALETRRQKARLRRIEFEIELEKAQQELNDLRTEAENPEKVFMSILQKGFLSQQNNPPAPAKIPTPLSDLDEQQGGGGLVLSRKEIKKFFKALPSKQRTLIRYADDNILKEAILQKIPHISQESLDLCIEVAREK